ncbi:MAG: mannose-1-phosphate guanylyltransferase/mannose-6-phosphate isomerase [Candidatus Omnitrophica bacterium]|nr:mannose-1-phosphate guanylyltransferase/mannose-6-phosphate isomerase [Candidatus Omnitrophota bacterium]
MKKSNHNYVVILAGGQGSRFWPLSRSLEPKQFFPLHSTKSLFHETISRIKTLIPPQNIFIVANQLHFSEIFNYAFEFKIPRSNIILEPVGKNTAPSVGVASRLIMLSDPEAKLVILPSDHLIRNQKGFRNLLRYAFSLTGDQNNLVIFGIPPDSPATGYGYIKIKKSKIKNQKAYQVEKFIEKPNIKTAKRIFQDKRYFWNSGMFFGLAKTFLNEIKNKLPSLYRSVSQMNKPEHINKIWRNIKPISFDFGVLEKSKNLLMIPASNLGWSDLGTWASLDKILPKDKRANTINADAVILGSKNITVFGKNRLIACLGLENLIVVDTPDALLITRKDKSEEVKRVVEDLKKDNRKEVYLHRTVRRPWGSYTVLDRGSGFKIKLVEVSPRKALSLQKHMRRSEHWIVVEGRAKITKGKKVNYLNANKSSFIPVRHVHRLENPTDSLLKIIEVQSGDYLEEDDIVRIKDNFERI